MREYRIGFFFCARRVERDEASERNETKRKRCKRTISLPNSLLASTTALYPVMFAWELKASYVCPRLKVRGMQSIANAVAF